MYGISDIFLSTQLFHQCDAWNWMLQPGPVNLALGSLWLEDLGFMVITGYIARACFKNPKVN